MKTCDKVMRYVENHRDACGRVAIDIVDVCTKELLTAAERHGQIRTIVSASSITGCFEDRNWIEPRAIKIAREAMRAQGINLTYRHRLKEFIVSVIISAVDERDVDHYDECG